MYPPDSPFFLLRQAACLTLLAPLMALAQGPASARDAANPDAPQAPLIHPAMPLPALQQRSGTPPAHAQLWQAAHDAVAAFPRGHADILAWEKKAAAHPAQAPRQPTHDPMHTPMPMPMPGGKP